MLLKVILLLISLFFLFGGGLCSFFLLVTASLVGQVLGIIMALVALWATIEVFRWNPAGPDSEKRKNRALLLVFLSAALVIALYLLSFSGLINIRFGG